MAYATTCSSYAHGCDDAEYEKEFRSIKPILFLKHFENMQTLDMHIYERVVMATPAFRDVWTIGGFMTCGVKFMTQGVNFMTKEKDVS